MKKVVFLILFSFACMSAFSQLKTTYDAGDVTGTDTTHWTRIEGNIPVTVCWVFTDLNANDATAEIFYGDEDEATNDIIPISVEKSSTVNRRYPLTLDKTNSALWTIVGSDTTNVFGVEKSRWLHDYIGIKLTLNSVTDGDLIQHIER